MRESPVVVYPYFFFSFPPPNPKAVIEKRTWIYGQGPSSSIGTHLVFFPGRFIMFALERKGEKIKEVPQESVPLTRLRNLCCVGLCSRYLDFLISALVVVAYSLTAIVIDYDAVGCGCIRGMFPSKARQRDARNHCRGV